MSISFRTNCTINDYAIEEKADNNSNKCVGIRIVNLENNDWITRTFDGDSMRRDDCLTHAAKLCEDASLNWKEIKEKF